MDVKILNTEFFLIGVVDTYTYLRYTDDFRDAGELEMRLPFDASLYALLSSECALLVEDMLYTVKRIRVENNEIYAYALGFFAELREFYTSSPVLYEMSASSIILSLISALKFEEVTFKTYGITGSETAIQEYDACASYYDVIKRIARENGVGFRFSYDPSTRELAFRVLSVTDRASPSVKELCVISDRRDSYLSLEAHTDIANYKNIVDIVYGYGTDGELLMYSLNRCSVYEKPRRIMDSAQSLIFTDERTRSIALRTYAEKLLARHAKKDSFTVKLLCNPGARIGDLCYFESVALGRTEYCLTTAREVCFSDTCRTETLTLEVQ